MMIRKAEERDVDAMASLAAIKREQYETYQPVFHKRAKDATETHRSYLPALLKKDNALLLVAEIKGKVVGFIYASLIKAPPVYDPGGLVCSVDDFCVEDGTSWNTVGRSLLEEAIKRGKERGAALVIVVCGPLDTPKRSLLTAYGLTVASEWHVASI